jgi:hypothetical protein
MTAAAAGARDATRLEPVVCIFYILFRFLLYTNVLLGPLNALKQIPQH